MYVTSLRFRACRINDRCYLEEFEGTKAIRLVATNSGIPRDLWNSAYVEFRRLANRLSLEHDSLQETGWPHA